MEDVISVEKETRDFHPVQQPHIYHTSRDDLPSVPSLPKWLGGTTSPHGQVTKCRYCSIETTVPRNCRFR